MNQIKIALVSLGSLKFPVDITYLERWNSDIMKIVHGASVGQLQNAEGYNWEYPNDQLRQLIHADPEANFTVALINAPLVDNYYMHRLDDKIVVLSLYEMADIIHLYNFTIENFILRNLYELVVLYVANDQLIPEEASSWTHDETRGCLFDMNASKSDIVFSMHKPKLCHNCRNRILSKQISSGFIPALDKELLKIQKKLYFRISEWVKNHPIYALMMTAGFGIFLNIISSMFVEHLKK